MKGDASLTAAKPSAISNTGRPTRVINDADLQGYGVISGRGVELVLTLGTGLGSALFVDGHLVPNLELGHHPFRRGRTYEELISDRVLKAIGQRRWRRRGAAMVKQLASPAENANASGDLARAARLPGARSGITRTGS